VYREGETFAFSPKDRAEGLLRGEGFAEVHYVKVVPGGAQKALDTGEVDLTFQFVGPLIISVDAGHPIVMLAGGHISCFELFGTDRVRAIRDLKDKTVAVPALGSPQHVFLASMAAYVGLDPRKDIHWVTDPRAEAMRLFAEGQLDAFLGLPPEPQELRAKQVGHVVVNSMIDRPWSQYFCCMVVAHRTFVQRHPVATKRALRAILKAANVCALEPDRVARFLVDKGYTTNYEYTLQAVKEIPYGKWREYDPEDTVRFYALRLHEVGMLTSSPQKLIAQGTDWRFLNELKKELKGLRGHHVRSASLRAGIKDVLILLANLLFDIIHGDFCQITWRKMLQQSVNTTRALRQSCHIIWRVLLPKISRVDCSCTVVAEASMLPRYEAPSGEICADTAGGADDVSVRRHTAYWRGGGQGKKTDRKNKRHFAPAPAAPSPAPPAGGHALPTALAAHAARRGSPAGAARSKA
jgi:NitT/TauT family transport system substrate-binding protein